MQIWLPEQLITDPKDDKNFQNYMIKHSRTIRSKMTKKKCTLVLPKFSISYKSDITDNLKNMNITKVFTSSADLSPMLGDEHDAYVKSVNHAVKFDIDENGIEGAAITTIQISRFL
jgi:serine protease inhibitor